MCGGKRLNDDWSGEKGHDLMNNFSVVVVAVAVVVLVVVVVCMYV